MSSIEKIKSEFDIFLKELKKPIRKDEKLLLKRVESHLSKKYGEIMDSLEGCESPIERLFSIELNEALSDSKLNFMFDVIECIPQYAIKIFPNTTNEKTYRIDFLVKLHDLKNDKEYGFAIECDGHEFHEKTKEQVAKDKKRDRDLLRAGVIPIRFSGSEIYENPSSVVRDAVRIIERYSLDMYK